MTYWSRRLVLLGALGLSGAAWGKDKKERKKAGRKGGPLGLLSGTVFHPGGLSLPGASVTAFATDGGKDKWEGVTDARGEFALRLPATIDGIRFAGDQLRGNQAIDQLGRGRCSHAYVCSHIAER